jgi:hypothetical protein
MRHCAGEGAGARSSLVMWVGTRRSRGGGWSWGYGRGVLRVTLALSLQGRELVLLQADHVQQSVDLAFGLCFEFLMQFSQARLAVVVWVCGAGENAGSPPSVAWAVSVCRLLHLSRRRHCWVVEEEVVHEA